MAAASRELDAGFASLTAINIGAIARTHLIFCETRRGRASFHEQSARSLLDTYLRHGELQHVPGIMAALAAVLNPTGRPAEAAATIRSVFDHPDVQRSIVFRVMLRHQLAISLIDQGQTDDARSLLADAVQDCDSVGDIAGAADAERLLGALDRDSGEHRAAAARLHRAGELYQEVGDPVGSADVLEEVAGLALDIERFDVAARLLGAAV